MRECSRLRPRIGTEVPEDRADRRESDRADRHRRVRLRHRSERSRERRDDADCAREEFEAEVGRGCTQG